MDKEVVVLYTMEYYSAIKRNEIESFVETWMDLVTVIQSEVKKEVEMANKSMKKCSKAYVIRELQLKTMRYNEIQLHTY